MFGHRSDGRKLKTVPPFFRVIPCVMLERNDAQVYFKQDIKLKELDEEEKREKEKRIFDKIFAEIRTNCEKKYENDFIKDSHFESG